MPRPIGLVSKKAVSHHTRITSRVSPPRSHSRASQSHRTSHRRTSSGPVRPRAVPASRLREAPPRAPTPPVKSCRFGCAVFQKTKKAARDGGVFESAHHGQGELGRGGWAVQVRHYGDAGVAHEYGGTRARRYRSPAVSIASRVAPPPARRERRNFGHFPRRHSGAGKVSRGRRKISRPLPLSPALTEPIPGLRPQDAHATVLGLDEDTAFFGVYDGHGGKEVRPPPAPGSIASDVAERRSFFPRAKCFFLVALARPVARANRLIANRVADRSLLSRTRSTALAAADNDDDVSVTLVSPRSDRDPTARDE